MMVGLIMTAVLALAVVMSQQPGIRRRLRHGAYEITRERGMTPADWEQIAELKAMNAEGKASGRYKALGISPADEGDRI